MERLRVLTLVTCYLPGYKGGGPIRTIANLVDQLGDELDFKVITADRDVGDQSPYSGVAPGVWTQVGKGEVMYLEPERLSMTALWHLLNKTRYDVLYLNSFFSPGFTIKPLLLRRVGLFPRVPVIVAPRGEFSPGALAFKTLKKRIHIHVSRFFGLYSDVAWQASTEHEAADIRRSIGSTCNIVVAPNLPASGDEQTLRKTKAADQLRIVFLSRISRKKNLDGALRMLQRIRGDIRFNIYGPIEDPVYWDECLRLIAQLPTNVTVRYRGPIEHQLVGAVMADHDVLLLPTHGENFGHVILEAMAVGTPVLISDQTPWRELERHHAGWDLPLHAEQQFQEIIQTLALMDAATHGTWSNGASNYGTQCRRDLRLGEQNRALFLRAVR